MYTGWSVIGQRKRAAYPGNGYPLRIGQHVAPSKGGQPRDLRPGAYRRTSSFTTMPTWICQRVARRAT